MAGWRDAAFTLLETRMLFSTAAHTPLSTWSRCDSLSVVGLRHRLKPSSGPHANHREPESSPRPAGPCGALSPPPCPSLLPTAPRRERVPRGLCEACSAPLRRPGAPTPAPSGISALRESCGFNSVRA